MEVFNSNSWMTICGYQWTLEHARVVCRQLSMPKATGATIGKRFPPGSGEILSHDLSCTGQETEILDCTAETRDLKCDHRSDAGVICGVWGHGRLIQFILRVTFYFNFIHIYAVFAFHCVYMSLI